MEKTLYNLHLLAGKTSGRKRTCAGKTVYESEEKALLAALNHNRWINRRHDVEAYPCYFCKKWHIGGVMSKKVLRKLAAQNVSGYSSVR